MLQYWECKGLTKYFLSCTAHLREMQKKEKFVRERNLQLLADQSLYRSGFIY